LSDSVIEINVLLDTQYVIYETSQSTALLVRTELTTAKQKYTTVNTNTNYTTN